MLCITDVFISFYQRNELIRCHSKYTLYLCHGEQKKCVIFFLQQLIQKHNTVNIHFALRKGRSQGEHMRENNTVVEK